jgi:hypothetical protein
MFFLGMIVGAAILGFVLWSRNKGWKFNWYEWLIGSIGLIFLFIAVQHYFASRREFVDLSANLGLIYFGIPAIILFAVVWQLVARRQKKIAV